MSDDKSKRNSPDSKRINPNEDYEVKYWSEKFNVTANRLKQAVKAVGNAPEKVKEYLKK